MIKIGVKDKEALRLLTDLQGRGANMSPVMRQIAGIMHDAVEQNFEAEGRPRWRPSKRALMQQGKTLQKSGQLAASIAQKHDARSARVGTNTVYAAIHQFGGKAGRGRKVTIPARPFLKLTDADIEEIKEALRNYLLRGK
ncbi:MAG: phage virion morphogenesis protein [Nitrospirota bacterium]